MSKRTRKPKTAQGVKCGTCPAVIFEINEVGGKIFIKDGKPMCARCRILKGSKFVKEIEKDKPIFEKQMKEREAIEQAKENEELKKVAYASQLRTNVFRKIIKKRKK